MVAHPNRWRATPGEMVLAQNVTLENDLLNKEPAATYYDPQGLDALQFQLTWTPPSSTDPALALALWYDALPTTTIVDQTIVAGTAGTVPSPWTQPIAANLAVGTLHAIRVTCLAGGATAVTDARGNVYTAASDQTYTVSGSTLHAQIWVSGLTTAVTSGDLLTITLSAGTANLNVVGTAFVGIAHPLTLRATGYAEAGSSQTLSITGQTQEYPVVGIGLGMSTNPTITADFTQAGRFTAPTNVNLHQGGHTQASLTMAAGWSPNKIVTQIEWVSDATTTLTPPGAVSVTAGSNLITGPANWWGTSVRPGDTLIIGGESQVVDNLTAQGILTIAPWQMSHSATSVIRKAGPVIISAVNNDTIQQGLLYEELPQAGAKGAHGQLSYRFLTSALARVRPGRFVIGGKEVATNPRKLFYLNGVDPVQVLAGDGLQTNPIASPALDWGTAQDATKQPLGAIVHSGQSGADSLVIWGNLNDPHRVYMSVPTNHEDFQSTNLGSDSTMSTRVASHVGRRLYGAAEFQGVLYFWKYPAGIFYLDDTDTDRTKWGYRIRSTAVGCAPSPHAVLATDDDVIFCDAQGHFHLLSAVATLGGTRDSDITRAQGLHTWTNDTVDMKALTTIVSTYDPQTKTAWFGLRSLQAPANNPGDNDLVIRWDLSQMPSGGAPRMTTARVWAPNSLCLKQRNYTGRASVLIGEYGNAWYVEPQTYGRRTNYDYVAHADAPQGIAIQVDLPELECGQLGYTALGATTQPNLARRKAFRALELITQAPVNSGEVLTIAMDIDGVRRQSLGFPQYLNRRRLQTLKVGDGYACTPHLSTDGSVVGDLPIIGLIVYFDLLGSDNSRKS
jgi:hypothetical protein